MKSYQKNIEKYNIEILRLSKLLNRLSLFRLLVFVISIICLIILFRLNLNIPAFIVLPISIIGFGFVIKYHDKIAYLKLHTSFLKIINESEIQREKCNLEGLDTGQKFIDQNHPYTSDLDIFGQHSLFQLVNRATTESGMILLSKWLSEAASNSEIYDRQKAIKEVAKKSDWIQDFQASGMHFENNKSDYYNFLKWVEAPVSLLKNRNIYLAIAIILPVLLLLNTCFFYANLGSKTGGFYLFLMIIVFLTSFLILRKIKTLAEHIVETSTKNLKTLRGYLALTNKIENESFKSKKLRELQSKLINDKYSAYNEINSLCKILDFSHQRPIKKIPIGGNFIYPILNSVLLLDIYLILGTEKWKSKNKSFINSWAAAISEFEVINSFAGFYYSNPSYTFPEIAEKNNYVHFESLGHPLINSTNRVCNDFQTNAHRSVIMITGSNMAGKSTFLRSVGLNSVLALAGAPCCAKKGTVSSLKLYTSMRTQDNLEKGISSFYAELDRIEKMLKLIGENQNVFFLLDEMFKGTNSEDRYTGGFSLITQMSKLSTSGIIATHDIELAKISENKKVVTNYSFNSEMINNSMIFNYKLHHGICYDFNASELMKKSGIEILPNIQELLN
jgi:hypothetical protein